MNPLQGLLHLLADPNIAFVLFTIGVYGAAVRAPEPELRDRDPRARSRSSSRSSGSAACRSTSPGCCSIVLGLVLFALETDRHEPRPAHGRRDRLLRAGRVRAVHEPGRPVRSRSSGWPLPLHRDRDRDHGRVHGPDHAGRDPDPPDGRRRRAPSASPVPLGTDGRRPGARSSRSGSVYAGGEEWTARTADERPLAARDPGPRRPDRRPDRRRRARPASDPIV